MFRLSGLLCIGFAILCGSLLFKTSQSVQRAEQNLSVVQDDVNTEQESLRILSAEWDYLNRPERLEKLTLENLDMDENHADKANFIEEGASVPEPYAPVTQEAKPQYVSTENKTEKTKSSVIVNTESKDFNKTLEGGR